MEINNLSITFFNSNDLNVKSDIIWYSILKLSQFTKANYKFLGKKGFFFFVVNSCETYLASHRVLIGWLSWKSTQHYNFSELEGKKKKASMEATPEGNESSRDAKTLISFYSNYLSNRFTSLFPSFPLNFLEKISNLYRQTLLPISTKRRAGLPLPLPSNSVNSTRYTTFTSVIHFHFS